MVLQIPENSALLLGGSADSMADLPQQAFALTLSDDVLEGMIESVRNGQEIQLSLGDTPVSLARALPSFLQRLLLLSGGGEETVSKVNNISGAEGTAGPTRGDNRFNCPLLAPLSGWRSIDRAIPLACCETSPI